MKWHKRACRIGSCAVLLLLVVQPSTLAIALDPPLTNDSFVGTWQAQFQGKPFVTLKLTKQDTTTTLTGTISHSTVQLDNSGELSSAEQKDGEDPVSEASLKASTLHLTSKALTRRNSRFWARPQMARLRNRGNWCGFQPPQQQHRADPRTSRPNWPRRRKPGCRDSSAQELPPQRLVPRPYPVLRPPQRQAARPQLS